MLQVSSVTEFHLIVWIQTIVTFREYWMSTFRGPGSPPPLPSASCLPSWVFLCIAGRVYWRKVGDGEREEKNIRQRDSLVLYKSSILSVYIEPTLKPSASVDLNYVNVSKNNNVRSVHLPKLKGVSVHESHVSHGRYHRRCHGEIEEDVSCAT